MVEHVTHMCKHPDSHAIHDKKIKATFCQLSSYLFHDKRCIMNCQFNIAVLIISQKIQLSSLITLQQDTHSIPEWFVSQKMREAWV